MKIQDEEILKAFINGKLKDKIGLKCKCGGDFIIRQGYSKFCGCSNYPKCTEKVGLVQETVPRSDICRIAFSEQYNFNYKTKDFTINTFEEDFADYELLDILD